MLWRRPFGTAAASRKKLQTSEAVAGESLDAPMTGGVWCVRGRLDYEYEYVEYEYEYEEWQTAVAEAENTVLQCYGGDHGHGGGVPQTTQPARRLLV